MDYYIFELEFEKAKALKEEIVLFEECNRVWGIDYPDMDYFAFEKEKYFIGMCDENGKITIDPVYSYMLVYRYEITKNDVAYEVYLTKNEDIKNYDPKYNQDGLFMFYTSTQVLKEIYPCKYRKVQEFHGDYLLHQNDLKLKLDMLDQSKKRKFWDRSYDQIIFIYNNCYMLQDGNKLLLVDLNGNSIFEKNMTICSLQQENSKFCLVQMDKKYNYIDEKGKLLLPEWANDAQPFQGEKEELYALVKFDNVWKILNFSGKLLNGKGFDRYILSLKENSGHTYNDAWILERDNKEYFIKAETDGYFELELTPGKKVIKCIDCQLIIDRQARQYSVRDKISCIKNLKEIRYIGEPPWGSELFGKKLIQRGFSWKPDRTQYETKN